MLEVGVLVVLPGHQFGVEVAGAEELARAFHPLRTVVDRDGVDVVPDL